MRTVSSLAPAADEQPARRRAEAAIAVVARRVRRRDMRWILPW
jgi:hypothetical protein